MENKAEILDGTQKLTSIFFIPKKIKLLVILFLINLFAQKVIFKHIKKKHGQEMVTIVRSFQQQKMKYMKTVADIKFIKSCKTSNVIPTFGNVNLSTQYGSYKLKKRIARIIMENELQCKHTEKKKVRKEILQLDKKLRLSLNIVIYHTLLHQISIAAKSRLKAIGKRHAKKLTKFNNRQNKTECQEPKRILKNIVHNFSSDMLASDELVAFSHGLDHQIPIRNNRSNITTEFEYFYQNLLNHISHIPEVQLSQIKTNKTSLMFSTILAVFICLTFYVQKNKFYFENGF